MEILILFLDQMTDFHKTNSFQDFSGEDEEVNAHEFMKTSLINSKVLINKKSEYNTQDYTKNSGRRFLSRTPISHAARRFITTKMRKSQLKKRKFQNSKKA